MPRRATPPPPRGYNWTRYTDGDWWAFTSGKDYTTPTPTFIQAARMWAKRNGYRLHASTTDRGCKMQFLKNAP